MVISREIKSIKDIISIIKRNKEIKKYQILWFKVEKTK